MILHVSVLAAGEQACGFGSRWRGNPGRIRIF